MKTWPKEVFVCLGSSMWSIERYSVPYIKTVKNYDPRKWQLWILRFLHSRWWSICSSGIWYCKSSMKNWNLKMTVFLPPDCEART